MTDVIMRINNSNNVRNGDVVISSENRKNQQRISPPINQDVGVSGYNGATTNPKTDTRFTFAPVIRTSGGV